MLSQSIRSSRLAALFTGVFALALHAPAQQFPSCPLTTNGADVICGAIQDAANYNVASSMDAVSLGTTSCNIGNANLNWISGTVNHPLMGGQVYKYKVVNSSGRFESLGQSWLKHAFLAFQENLCCSNCSPTDGQHLGVGCSDPYTASRNGTQSGLGPKYQVNANTGQYVAAPPHPTGGNNGRIQMLLTDLEPSSASVRYFGEMMYVALDDSRNNNNDNSVSYRELSVTAGTATTGFVFGVTGSTQRMLAGIEAWKVIDPVVKLTNISSPESSVAPYDGNARLVLGSRVTNLGGGTWHYEYALYNQNSDRAVQSFRVPVPASATVTNVGFRDVAYLGNDGNGNVNFDGTDWPMVRAGDALTWATTPFATNANANALRWGTTYNFRFDANVAPATGTVDLAQFKVVNGLAVPGVDVPGAPPAFEAFCTNGSLGTDHTTACPCGNTGLAANGCAHSFDAGGANLSATGTPASDNVVLTSQLEPSASFTLFIQHDAAGDAVFHDGVLCAGGTLVRLRGRAAVAGVASFPNNAFAQDSTTTLSQRGGVTAGSGARRYYAAWFRNASTTFCPPATANVTNGWKLDW
jgi:hypothetical protein